ncbi:MAG: nuclear transport factor 2 family protein [bacterium]
MNQNVKLVQDVYAAIGRGDVPAVLGMLAEDVEIQLPGPDEIPFAGTYRGHDGFTRFATAMAGSIDWDTRKFEVRELIAEGDQVVALGHEQLTALPTGRSWETDWAMAWTVRDGKVTRLREYHQTDAIAAAYR